MVVTIVDQRDLTGWKEVAQPLLSHATIDEATTNLRLPTNEVVRVPLGTCQKLGQQMANADGLKSAHG